ncbi:hypothetical protein BPAE_0048g00190 [Botrytis paeoniae]|uniref:Uncharacterized protein n=1 Tax=Botrytis paeoniae TaxID=278948 RepID=A0A4Z1FTR5_9HELO|nr:hypothetical protein BPAE_0048g00190 [Botrytis paeoniae]
MAIAVLSEKVHVSTLLVYIKSIDINWANQSVDEEYLINQFKYTRRGFPFTASLPSLHFTPHNHHPNIHIMRTMKYQGYFKLRLNSTQLPSTTINALLTSGITYTTHLPSALPPYPETTSHVHFIIKVPGSLFIHPETESTSINPINPIPYALRPFRGYEPPAQDPESHNYSQIIN